MKIKTKERLDYYSPGNKIVIYYSKLMYQLACEYCKKNDQILDLGCGLGWGANLLSGKGMVKAIDIDKKTIQRARKRYFKNKKVKFIQADAINLSFKDQQFDIVVSIENIEHVKNWRKYVKEVKRVLKKDGLLFLTTPNRGHLGKVLRKLIGLKTFKNRFHHHEFIEEELISFFLKQNFKVEKLRRFIFCLPISLLKVIEKSDLLVKTLVNCAPPGVNDELMIVLKKV